MGEENQQHQKKEQETKKVVGSEEEKKKQKTEEEEGAKNGEKDPLEIVLKVDMHCEACARKVGRALKGFEGVEEVIADHKASKVVVKGKAADPSKVCERLQKKSGKKVELISPLHIKAEQGKRQEKMESQTNEEQKEKKEEAPSPITVVLKVRMHCEACAQGLQKRVRKIQGVDSVETNLHGGQVTVTGIFDPEKLVNCVKKRTGKQAYIVKEEGKKEEKKEIEQKKEEKEEKDDEMKPSEYYYDHAYPPQMFSDDNPNACNVM